MARKTNPAVAALQAQPGGYKTCDWETSGERCRYPASIDGRWCTEHYRCDDPIWGGHVVAASRDYRHLSERERHELANQRLMENANAYLAKNGLTKRPGESSKDYIGRLRAHCRGLFSVVVKQQRAA